MITFPSVSKRLSQEFKSIVLFALSCIFGYILFVSIFNRPFFSPISPKPDASAAPPDYGSSLATVLIIIACSLAAGRVVEWARLPSLLGMLVAGIALGNLAFAGDLTVPRGWATVLRRAAFVVILLRGALALDAASLKRTGGACVRLSLLPSTAEALTIAALSLAIFNLPPLFGLLLGFLLAAASPAVVVPSIIAAVQEGYGAHLSSMIIASCSLDDVYNISVFTAVLAIIFSTGDSLVLTLVRGPIEVVAGCILGGAVGYLARFAPSSSRFPLLLVTSFTIYFGCIYAHVDSCGTMAVLVGAFVAAMEWKKKEGFAACMSSLRQLWDLLGQPLLFGLIGFSLDLSTLSWSLVLRGCLLLLVAVVVRTTVAFFAVMGAGLTASERVFVALSWPSKATVQAALATAAVDLVDAGGYGAEYRQAANVVFALAVLSILTTAPLGAILIRVSAPRLLQKAGDAEREKEDATRF